MAKALSITGIARTRLALHALTSERSVYRWYTDPDDVSPYMDARLRRAARDLALPLPPEQQRYAA